MSFILDALKKSENDRQRQSGPALYEVRVAPPRPRFPPWALVVVALLLVNVAVVGWLMMRKPAIAAAHESQPSADAAQPAAAAPVQTAPPIQPAPAPQYYPPPAQAAVQPQGYPAPQYAPQPQYAQPQYGPPPQQQYGAPPPAPGYTPPQQQPAPGGTAFQGNEPQLADSRGAQESTNPDDYAPATEPSDSQPLGRVRRGTESGLPLYEDAAGKIGVPQLRLDLHVYAPDPRKRFIMLNMRRLAEGESLPDGVKVESITTDGAILSYHGSQFVMERE